MNVIVCGMMGVGKTTVGQALANALGYTWLDTDAVIEERHGKITDIFALHGEAHFRAIETDTVREIVQKENCVVSVGGGLVLREENVALLKSFGSLVLLRATKATLISRLQNDNSRPLLQGESLEKKIDTLLQVRMPIYERVADVIVDVDDKSAQAIADEIIALCLKK